MNTKFQNDNVFNFSTSGANAIYRIKDACHVSGVSSTSHLQMAIHTLTVCECVAFGNGTSSSIMEAQRMLLELAYIHSVILGLHAIRVDSRTRLDSTRKLRVYELEVTAIDESSE